MQYKVDARYHAYRILFLYQKEKLQLGKARDTYFSTAVILHRERQRVFVLTNEIARFQGRLNAAIAKAIGRSPVSLDLEVLTVLQIAAYELLIDSKTPDYAAISSAVNLIEMIKGNRLKGFVNAGCRSLQALHPIGKKDFMTPSDWYSVPKWMYTRWVKRYGAKEAGELCDYFNEPAHITIRRNTELLSEAAMKDELSGHGISVDNIPDSESFYKIIEGGSALFSTNVFKEGLVSIQDRAAGAIVEVLDPQPGETVLDVCAAPGTKSLYIAEKVGKTGKVYASDADEERVNKGRRDVSRHSNRNIFWNVRDCTKSDYELADKILVDAPCTGTGVIQRRPDIRWKRQYGDLRAFSETQKNILNHMAQFVKPGGLLVYATCSLEPEENWLVCDSFLKLNKNFTMERISDKKLSNLVNEEGHLETFPPLNHMDGMFAVKLRRNS